MTTTFLLTLQCIGLTFHRTVQGNTELQRQLDSITDKISAAKAAAATRAGELKREMDDVSNSDRMQAGNWNCFVNHPGLSGAFQDGAPTKLTDILASVETKKVLLYTVISRVSSCP
jgi:hypothetical protein